MIILSSHEDHPFSQREALLYLGELQDYGNDVDGN